MIKNKYLVLACLVLLLDRVGKAYVQDITINQALPLGIVLLSNELLACLQIVLVVGICYFALIRRKNLELLALAVASLSNLWDRLMYGGVIDYLQIVNIRFNLADLFISSFVIIIIVKYLGDDRKKHSDR